MHAVTSQDVCHGYTALKYIKNTWKLSDCLSRRGSKSPELAIRFYSFPENRQAAWELLSVEKYLKAGGGYVPGIL